MILETVIVGPLEVNCYILGCEKTGEAVVIDPGADADRIIPVFSRHGLKIIHVLNTHGHFDHVGGNRTILEATGADLLIHEADIPLLSRASESAAVYGLRTENSPLPDRYLVDGMIFPVGTYEIKVLHTPGHTPGGCCLHVDGIVITGDTLFADSVGRTDFPGGSTETLMKSIHDKLLKLPDETVVYPGHGPSTSIGREKRHNPYLAK
jgi:glyoxylase-like metal-dependent hydrolase (beta-lactamase superfamily II)